MHHTLNTCYVHEFVVSGARCEKKEEEVEDRRNIKKKNIPIGVMKPDTWIDRQTKDGIRHSRSHSTIK